MRRFDDKMRDALAPEATTLCRCWRIRRKDGVELGFTDHDRPLSFQGLTFEPQTGFAPSEAARSLGLAVDNVEATGALRSDAIAEADILAGLYDGAEITQWLVDHADVEARSKISVGHAGEIRRGEGAFEMEVLGLAEALNRPVGRIYQRTCDAELGDARCGVSLTGGFRRSGQVASLRDPRRFVLTGDAASAPATFFDHGQALWDTGANAGRSSNIRAYYRQGGDMLVDLWSAPAAPLGPGDEVTLVAGCDKTSGACSAKFSNLMNFRGFPLMPGEDWALAYPRADEDHDGGSLFGG